MGNEKWSQIKKYVLAMGSVLLFSILVWYTKEDEGALSENGNLAIYTFG